MLKQVDIRMLPSEAADLKLIKKKAAKKSKWSLSKVKDIRILKRSIDARGNRPYIQLRIELTNEEPFQADPAILSQFQSVENKKEVIIVGAGPAGYFAALELIEIGLRPVIFERGKKVQARRRDLRAIQQFGKVDPHSNYCFGEGGAGTYSDGKLYTRSHKKGSIQKALKLFVEHGAKSDIMIDAHPHIGSNKLPQIVANIRETILQYGGEIHFNAHVTDFIFDKEQIKGVIVNDKEEHFADAVILATGHSAKDIYELLHRKGVRMEMKPFALGVRIEHRQKLIDQIQYNQLPREEELPAASYKLTCQVDGRGVFSFCMCPGGLVVPTATSPGEIVVNGMSLSRRDSPFANSGVVVAVEESDLTSFNAAGVFAGLTFQNKIEKAMFNAGDGSQKAPALRLTDFVKGKFSTSLPNSSYIPGLFAAPLYDLLPKGIYERLARGVQIFGRKMKGYFTEEAVVIGVESRTSSPIRIPRNRESMMHDNVIGLFPCGEGAGFAGGIISAAIDGQNIAKAVLGFYKQ